MLQLHVKQMRDGDTIEVDSVENLVAVESSGTVNAKVFYLTEVDTPESDTQ